MLNLKRIASAGLFTLCAVAQLGLTSETAFAGPGGTGGGNLVGNQLADDYDLQGTQQIPVSELQQIAAPYLKPLEQKIPQFAAMLEKGFTDVPWYTDSKTFNPKECDDQVIFQASPQIVACQSKASVRISASYFNSKPQPAILKDLIVHELLEHVKVANPSDHLDDEQVFAASRAIRDPSLSSDGLMSTLVQNGFANPMQYMTDTQIAKLNSDVCAYMSGQNTAVPDTLETELTNQSLGSTPIDAVCGYQFDQQMLAENITENTDWASRAQALRAQYCGLQGNVNVAQLNAAQSSSATAKAPQVAAIAAASAAADAQGTAAR